MTDDDMQDDVVGAEVEDNEEDDAGILPEDMPEIPDEEEETL